MNRTVTASVFAIAGIFLFSGPAISVEPGGVGTHNEYILKLSEVVQHDVMDKDNQLNLMENQINLITSSNSFHFALPIPKRIKIQESILHLDFTHSNALLKNRSQLRVEINGVIISQIAMDPQNTHVVVDIPVGMEFVRPGYNKVELKVAQHYTEKCENPSAPELWTQVNTIKSYFHFIYQYQPTRFTLAYLNDVFDKKMFDYRLTILRPRSPDQYNDTDLLWGALATQGVSLRLEYKPVTLNIGLAKAKDDLKERQLELSDDPLIGLDQSGLKSDIILIGTVDELRQFLHPEKKKDMVTAISGPYISLYPSADPRFCIVVISGRTEEEVTRAATAFTLTRFPFPDHNSMVIEQVALPFLEAGTMPRILQPGIRYAFKDLGFLSFTGYSHQRSEVFFRVPPDLLAREKTTVNFKLDLAYGAGFREDSVLNIYLNGLFVKAIALDNKMGTRFNDYEFYIPVADFLPGANILNFVPILQPLISGDCSPPPTGNAVVTIFDSSSMELPLVDHYVKLPDFNLFNRTGFPYLNNTFGADMGIVVRGQKNGSITAAWQMLAKLTQIAATPLHETKISFNNIEDRNLIIVGDRNSLDQEDLRNAPVSLGDMMQFDYSINKRPTTRKGTGFIDKLKSFATPLLPGKEGTLQEAYAILSFRSSLGRDCLLLGYPSARNPDKLTMLLTNEDPERLRVGARRLIDPDFWDVLQDNLAVWNTDDYSLTTLRTSAEFFTGKTSLRNSLAYYYTIHKIAFLAVVIFLILVCAWFAYRWTKRYHQGSESNVSELE